MKDLAARFWQKIDKSSGPDGCWLWTGYRDRNCYGQIALDGKRKCLVHRVSWLLQTGSIPTLNILHSCDNPSCVNPAHLREGTQADNIRDMDARKRRRTGSFLGEKCRFSKLSAADVVEIRAMAESGIDQRIIAKRYRVAHSNINQIVNRRTWKHV